MLDLYQAQHATDQRALGMMSKMGEGPSLFRVMRELQAGGEPARRRISSSALRPVFARDMTALHGPSGAYLVGTSKLPFESLMARYSILAESGLQVFSGLRGNAVLPRLNTSAVGGWISMDGAEVAEGQPVFGQVAMVPKYWAIKLDVSHQLMQQSDECEAIVNMVISDAAGRAFDAAIIAGSGVSGQPTGVVNVSGVTAQSGTSLAHAGLLNMREQALLAGAREDRLLWVGHPTVQELLGGRERTSDTGRFLWDDGQILGRPAIATNSMPAGTLMVGDWSRVLVTIHDGDGIGVDYNPYSNFAVGLVAFRLIVALDVSLSPAASFSVATGIT